jgi:type IV pilus assembly protein PilW
MSRPKQNGFTLVELMVAMTVGLFLTAGMISLFIGSKQSYRATEALSRLQENGRFALEYLSRDVRQVGFRQIVGASTAAPLPNFIRGWDGSSTAPTLTAPSVTLTDYTPNTDIFRVRAEYDANSAIIGGAGLTAGRRHIFYYIANDSGEPALWQQIVDDAGIVVVKNVIVEGVSDMQVRYGLDTINNNVHQIDSYATAAGVADWDQVVAVRIDLLLRSSENNLTENPMSLPFEKNSGSFFSAPTGDRRMYQVFSTTIALRNKLK